MRFAAFVTLGLVAACQQAGPEIIDQPVEVETLDPGTVSSQPSLPPQLVEGLPTGPPAPVLDDGTPLHPPALPPGVQPDPNSNDLMSLSKRNCEICPGANGEGVIPCAELRRAATADQQRHRPHDRARLEGHGGAPAFEGKLKRPHRSST